MLFRRLSIVTTILTLVGAGIWGLKDYFQILAAPVVQVGANAPGFMSRTLSGSPVSIDFAGQKTLLVFFKIDCPHCHHELANIERLAQTYTDAGLRVIGLARTDNEALRERSFSFPVYIDQSNAMVGRFGRVMVPTLVMVDEKSVIRYLRSGANTFETDQQLVEAFLRGTLATAVSDGPLSFASEQSRRVR